MILLMVAALMGLTALALVVYPLLGLDRDGGEAGLAGAAGGVSEVTPQESAARQALLDVDFDWRLGNLDQDDYSQLRERYEERALVGLKARYEREQQLDAAIERQLAALRAGEKKVKNQGRSGSSSGAAPDAGGARRRRRKGG
jgi:uncharacterized sporulation protein YeaH/YhbH (DUF444 family)